MHVAHIGPRIAVSVINTGDVGNLLITEEFVTCSKRNVTPVWSTRVDSQMTTAVDRDANGDAISSNHHQWLL
ncbi:hypothetical protein AZE42_05032 [Rhizopogon vesiculosus]|uniref:Uncharacterized protein n=1 Tax=Rhizopogon vesiculosus TaxID=180088 RepID=A0A1J8PZ66_9AGAM|nr:hypothetical protein AZE42_05032 [Rhizopogon vesiculosus]